MGHGRSSCGRVALVTRLFLAFRPFLGYGVLEGVRFSLRPDHVSVALSAMSTIAGFSRLAETGEEALLSAFDHTDLVITIISQATNTRDCTEATLNTRC